MPSNSRQGEVAKRCILLLSVFLFAASVDRCDAFRVAAISIPAYGHFMPVKGIAERLLLRGHDVTMFVEDPSWCESELRDNVSYGCVVMPVSGTFSTEMLRRLSALEDLADSFTAIFNEILEHNRQELGHYLESFGAEHTRDPFDLILMDLSTFVGFSLSKKFSVPHVSVFPLTMHMTVGPSTYLPSLGTEFPRKLSTANRLHNFLLKIVVSGVAHLLVHEMNVAHALHNIPPINSPTEIAGLDGLIFAPTIWGYDIPQPLCPNIVPLGAFSPSVLHNPMEPSLSAFLEQCSQGAVYVNFGTLAVVGDAMFERLREAMSQIPLCVVWKIAEDERRELFEGNNRFFVSKRFENPIAIMQHAHTKVFLTHCGDTSLLEAVQAELPLAGIPFFADQGDVCRRMNESGFGRYVGHKHSFTAQGLKDILIDVSSSPHYLKRIRDIHAISKLYGGAERAATMIEVRLANGLLHHDSFFETCAHLTDATGFPVSSMHICEYDFLIFWLSVVVFNCWLVVFLLKCLRRCLRREPAGAAPVVKVVKREIPQ